MEIENSLGLQMNPVMGMNADIARRVAEVQGEIMIAMSMPRNEMQCLAGIVKECETNKHLAEQALYAYPRGGQTVTGPSIRLAEVLARHWRHMDFGTREISNDAGQTEMEAFAWDKQSNLRVSKRFMVKHERSTKKGTNQLTDQRDIYELGANLGSRRVRACILQVIPGYVVDRAVEACKKRLKTFEVPIGERVANMVQAFSKFSVNVEMIENYIGHKLEIATPDDIVNLTQIFNSLKDGQSKREDWFNLKVNASKSFNEGLQIEKKPESAQ